MGMQEWGQLPGMALELKPESWAEAASRCVLEALAQLGGRVLEVL